MQTVGSKTILLVLYGNDIRSPSRAKAPSYPLFLHGTLVPLIPMARTLKSTIDDDEHAPFWSTFVSTNVEGILLAAIILLAYSYARIVSLLR
jgi:hypothetical protein